MKSIIKKNKQGKLVFIDKDNREWHPDNLQDLVNAVKKLKGINDIADYYFGE